MTERLTINAKKIFNMFIKSKDRSVGIEIESKIDGLKYILKDNSLVLATIENGVFAIGLDCIEDLADEIVEITAAFERRP